MKNNFPGYVLTTFTHHSVWARPRTSSVSKIEPGSLAPLGQGSESSSRRAEDVLNHMELGLNQGERGQLLAVPHIPLYTPGWDKSHQNF